MLAAAIALSVQPHRTFSQSSNAQAWRFVPACPEAVLRGRARSLFPPLRSACCAPKARNQNCSPWGKRGGEGGKALRELPVRRHLPQRPSADAPRWEKEV